MSLILHITSRQQWDAAQAKGIYHCDSLETEGFIHCSTPSQVVPVANAFFKGQPDLVLLCIESDRLHSKLQYDPVGDDQFPHLYGMLNLDAVIQVLDFPPNNDGKFEQPKALTQLN
jgi:uncharacterized protein (DUF952 family)